MAQLQWWRLDWTPFQVFELESHDSCDTNWRFDVALLTWGLRVWGPQLKSALNALYFGADHVVWASQAGLVTDKAKVDRAQKISLYSWLGASCCTIAGELTEILRRALPAILVSHPPPHPAGLSSSHCRAAQAVCMRWSSVLRLYRPRLARAGAGAGRGRQQVRGAAAGGGGRDQQARPGPVPRHRAGAPPASSTAIFRAEAFLHRPLEIPTDWEVMSICT